MIRLLLAALLLLGAAPAPAQEQGPAGRWALRADGRTLVILELSRTGDRIGFWRGGFRQPRTMRWSGQPGSGTFSFTRVEGPAIERPMRRAMPRDDGVHIEFAAPLPGQPDSFLFTLAADGSGALDMPGSGLPPLRLVRVGPGEAVAEGWDPARTYVADRSWPTNAEMTRLYEADQADRAPGGPAIDWSAVTPRDEARRARTLALVAAGALASGDDYWHAAFILQHGREANDFLLAHTFAIIAAARGRADATWIAAATLDRYLQKSGRPQIYGTQFNTANATRATTQDPYDRALVSDALRQALGVPPQADQERRRAEIEASFRARPVAPAPR
ncbi:MAG: hypothetical protein QOD42_3364 [Sphingomonadales bacterium]|jgi:hypothetical protein|nr:hypothetical protein [Sphingomonadales bacterium]